VTGSSSSRRWDTIARAAKARKMLGWSPKRGDLVKEIEEGCYRADVRGG